MSFHALLLPFQQLCPKGAQLANMQIVATTLLSAIRLTVAGLYIIRPLPTLHVLTPKYHLLVAPILPFQHLIQGWMVGEAPFST